MMNVFHLLYSLLHQVYKYLKANTFNDQGTDPTSIEQITIHLSLRGRWTVYGSWKRDVCLLCFLYDKTLPMIIPVNKFK